MRRWVVVVASLVWPAAAFAAPNESEKAIARTLFEQGRSLGKAGQWADACPKLAESQRLDPGIGTLYNVADCHEHIGKLALAWAEFSEVADLAKQSGQGEREKIARERVTSLNGRLAHLELKKGEPLPEGSDIVLDGRSVGMMVVGVPFPIDPGQHTVGIVVGGKTTEKTFIVPEGRATTTIELPPLLFGAPPEPSRAPAISERPTPAPASSWHKPVAYGVGAAGLAAIGVSVFLGFRAKSQWSTAEAGCPQDRCDANSYAGWQDARDTAMIGNIVFTAGVVAVAAAVVIWLTAPAEHARAAATR